MSTPSNKFWSAWIAHRDEAAFERLVRPALPALLDAARRTGLPAADADDVVQDALTELAKRRDGKPGQIGIAAWLMRSVRLRALSHRRSEARRKRRERRAGRHGRAPAPTTEGDVRRDVERAIAALDAADREVLLLRFLYDYDYRAIAHVLGASDNACRIRVHRALGRLRGHLGDRAPTMLALLPVAQAPLSSVWIATATKAAAAGVGSGLIGGLVMASSSKLVAAAVAGAIATGGLFLATGARWSTDGPTKIAIGDPANPPDTVDARSPTLESRGPLERLAPTSDERAWLRSALLAERERRAAARIRPGDSGLEILDRVFVHGADPWPLLEDYTRFAAHVQPAPESGVSLEVGAKSPTPITQEMIAPGTTKLSFGPGTFIWDRSPLSFKPRDQAYSHFEIHGAGVDETTLVLAKRFQMFLTAPHRHVRVRDLTIRFRDAGPLFDVRDEAAAVFENVRFIGWASGGHGAAVGVTGRGYLGFRGCTFQGEEHSGSCAVSIRGMSLVTFDECTFDSLYCPVRYSSGGRGSRVQIQDARLFDTRIAIQGTRTPNEEPEIELRVANVEAWFGDASMPSAKRRAEWGLPHVAEATGITLHPTERDLSLGAFKNVLASLPIPGEATLVSARITGWLGGNAAQVVLQLARANLPRTETLVLIRNGAGDWVPRAPGRRVRTSDLRPWREVERVPNLLRALERADSEQVRRVRAARVDMRLVWSPETQKSTLQGTLELQTDRSGRWVFDLDSGAVISAPPEPLR